MGLLRHSVLNRRQLAVLSQFRSLRYIALVRSREQRQGVEIDNVVPPRSITFSQYRSCSHYTGSGLLDEGSHGIN